MRFKSSPFYRLYTGLLQAEADKATIAVCSKLDSEDRYAIQHREQLIGAAPAFLWLVQKVESDLLTLQTIVTNQTNV